MKTVPLRALKPGMILGRPVFDKNREILLDAGITITDDYIKRLQSRNIRMVSILEDDSEEFDDDSFEETEDTNEDNSNDDILSKLETIGILPFQEAYEILKSYTDKLDDEAVVLKLAEVSNSVTNDKLLTTILDMLLKTSKLSTGPAFFLGLYGKQSDSAIKNLILKIMTNQEPDNDIINPVLYSLKSADTQTANEIFKLFEKYDKKAIETNSYKILAENDPALSSKIISLMKKLQLTVESSGVSTPVENVQPAPIKKVVKEETIHEVKKAEDELLSIQIDTPQVDSFDNVDESSFEKKISSSSFKQIDVKFEKIEYEKLDVEVFKNEYKQSVALTEEFIKSARANREIEPEAIMQIARKIVSQVVLDPKNAVTLSEFNTLNNYVISHSINTGYMAVLLGKLSNMSEDELMELAIGSLMHDIGMVKVKDLLWTRPEKLGFDDIFDIQKHTIFGIDTLSEISKFKGHIAYISYQHHERLDGSGYPKKKHGLQVPKYARIVGIADVFQAMTSSRIYRGSYDLQHVFSTLMRKDKNKYDQNFVKPLHDFYVKNINSELSDLGVEPKKVLIVDDSNEIRIITKKLLQNEFGTSLEIEFAEDGSQAIEIIIERKEIPDLILLDIMMPVRDGFGVIDELKLKNINIPIIMMTAKREQSSVLKAISSGLVKDYIVKPFEKAMIMEKVKKHLNI